MAAGLTRTRTAGFWLPWIETRPTPLTWLSFCARTVSAKSLTLSSGRLSEVIASERIGVSAGLTLL